MHFLLKCFFFSLIGLANSGCTISPDFDRGVFVPSKNQPVVVEFERYSKLIIVEAEINGIQGRFLLDNGFSLSAVNQGFADRAGITFDLKSKIRDANNTKSAIEEATVETVNINGQVFTNTGFYLVNTSVFLPCTNIDGVIGASIVRKANWKIDFINQTLQISSAPFNAKGTRFNTRFKNNNSTMTNIAINEVVINTKIDLGSTGSLSLSKKKYSKLFYGSEVEEKIGAQSLSALGLGKVQTSFYTSENFSFVHDGAKIANSSRVLLKDNLKYQGYLGIGYLDDYSVVINSTNDEYILSPAAISQTVKANLSYGISLYLLDGVWRVVSKDANNKQLSPIKPMDIVQEIDGAPANQIKTICELKSYLKQKKQQQKELLIKTNDAYYPLQLKAPSLTIY
jgi:hypothetical protein